MGRNNVIVCTCGCFLTLLILLAYFTEIFFFVFWKKYNVCGGRENDPEMKPFYFGTTNVVCMQSVRIKRSITNRKLPKRKYWSLNHRWIYYDGWYFELFYKPHTRRPAKSKYCSYEREAKPAGFSKLSVKCIRKCALYYNNVYAVKYKTFTRNCHHYANKLAEILCSHSECPLWCSPNS